MGTERRCYHEQCIGSALACDRSHESLALDCEAICFILNGRMPDCSVWDNNLRRRRTGEYAETYSSGGDSCGIHSSGMQWVHHRARMHCTRLSGHTIDCGQCASNCWQGMVHDAP